MSLSAVLPPDELMPYVTKYALNLIATVSPGSLRETKRQIYTDPHRHVARAVEAPRGDFERMIKEPNLPMVCPLSSKDVHRAG